MVAFEYQSRNAHIMNYFHLIMSINFLLPTLFKNKIFYPSISAKALMRLDTCSSEKTRESLWSHSSINPEMPIS